MLRPDVEIVERVSCIRCPDRKIPIILKPVTPHGTPENYVKIQSCRAYCG